MGSLCPEGTWECVCRGLGGVCDLSGGVTAPTTQYEQHLVSTPYASVSLWDEGLRHVHPSMEAESRFREPTGSPVLLTWDRDLWTPPDREEETAEPRQQDLLRTPGELCSPLGEPATEGRRGRASQGGRPPRRRPWGDTPPRRGALRRPPDPPTPSCTRSASGPGWASFQTLTLILSFPFAGILVSEAQLSQLVCSLHAPSQGAVFVGDILGDILGDLRRLRGARSGRGGDWAPAAPQRHLLALGGDGVEVGGFQAALAPAAWDLGWASDRCDLFRDTDS